MDLRSSGTHTTSVSYDQVLYAVKVTHLAFINEISFMTLIEQDDFFPKYFSIDAFWHGKPF